WFDRPKPLGIAVVGGKVSGNLEQLDFDIDAEEIFPAWCELVEAERPGLVGRLNVTRTPREPAGYQVRCRCPEVEIPGNTKIAEKPGTNKAGKPCRITLIETRGEGGYCIVPGTPGVCHPTGDEYQHHSGPDLCNLPTITAAEREALLRCAASFDRSPQAEA